MAQTNSVDQLAWAVQTAETLASGDSARLAEAIERAETHGLIPPAARMRVVLAQRTGDRAQLERARPLLERARPLLERLGDKLFLRRLEAVAAELPSAPGGL